MYCHANDFHEVDSTGIGRDKSSPDLLMQFELNSTRLVTKSEPGAVATGQGLNSKMQAMIESL